MGVVGLEAPGEKLAVGRIGLNGVGRPGVDAPNKGDESTGADDGALTGVAALLAWLMSHNCLKFSI